MAWSSAATSAASNRIVLPIRAQLKSGRDLITLRSFRGFTRNFKATSSKVR